MARRDEVTGRNLRDYEDGKLNLIEELQLFGELIRTGAAWTLQGSYGRQAHQYLEDGLLTDDGEIVWSRYDEIVESI